MHGVRKTCGEPRRLAAALLVLLATLPAVVGCARPRDQVTVPPRVDPGALVLDAVAGLSPQGPYRDPTRAERARAREAVEPLLTSGSGGGEASLTDLAFREIHGVDPVTGRPFLLYVDDSEDRGWGTVLIDRSMPVRLVVQVPHPRSDIDTEVIGVDLHRSVPGSVLLVAGAHRAAADGDADVAHNDRSLFHVLATEFARKGVPAIQLHGFADRNLPDAEAVVSSAAAPVTDLTRAVADRLAAAGITACRAWAKRCGRLEGTTNEQGRAAARHAPFVHLELSWSVRSDPVRRERAVEAVAALFATGDYTRRAVRHLTAQ